MQQNIRSCSTTTIVLFFIGASSILNTCLAQKTTVRPYQFGFEIEEQQHRSEKRDENGIVMGEFGFITADGIYHVTVYATDEEGRFKIVSMKNYPYSKRQKVMQMIQSRTLIPMITKAKPTSITSPTIKPTKAPPRLLYGAKACSGCSLRNPKPDDKNIEAEQPGSNEGMDSIDLRFGGNDYELGKEHLVDPQISYTAHENTMHTKDTIHNNKNESLYKGFNEKDYELGTEGLDNNNKNNKNNKNKNNEPNIPSLLQDVFGPIEDPVHEADHLRSVRDTQTRYNTNIKRTKPQIGRIPNMNLNPSPRATQGTNNGNSKGGSGAKSKTTTSTKAMPVNNDIPLVSRNLGNAAPSGSKVPSKNTKGVKNTNSNPATDSISSTGKDDDSEGDLYRFKYLLNYNGHSEAGKQNGNKVGNYHTISKDDVKHSIEYIANEFGYQPHVKLDRGIASVPSKDNALQEYEFIWFKKA